MNIFILSLSLFFWFGVFILTLLITNLRTLHKKESKSNFKKLGSRFLYRNFFLLFFPSHEFEGILFSTIVAQNISRFIALTSGSFWFFNIESIGFSYLTSAVALFFVAFFYFTTTDYLPRVIGSQYPLKTIKFAAVLSSPFLFFVSPITFIYLKISEKIWPTTFVDYLNEPLAEVKHEIFEILQDANLSLTLNPHDRKLIESVASFQSKIAREIMVPRIDLFCLDYSTSILDAAKHIEEQGYSRVPVYKGSIDQMVGVLMYKDVLAKFAECETTHANRATLSASIESLVKPVMYVPETKKISNLLQEFKKKQLHLAIVVDEYGGTAGIVTIEDILEEIVGEIEDEYDKEEDLYIKNQDGSWTVDARMSIIDLENELGITIKEEGDFETLGGYIFHCAGAIPSKGFSIKNDEIEIEVLKSNDRRVEKVKIKTIPNQTEG